MEVAERQQARALLSTIEFMLVLCKSQSDEVTVAEIMEGLKDTIEVVRYAAAVLVKDGRITVERKDPPEESVVSMTVCEENTLMMNMLAALYEKQKAAALVEKSKAAAAAKRRAMKKSKAG
jgi:hypothetical protein